VSNQSSVGQLLVVQARRVDRAMAAVVTRNRQLSEAQLKRDQAHASWEEADTLARAALDRRALVVANHLGRPLPCADLLIAARSVEWWRDRAAERAVQLEAARAAMLQAQKDADHARRVYREADARREALQKLAEEQRKAELQKSLRAQESDLEDRTSVNFAARLVDVA
jgi:hypothetical protein